MERFRQDLEQRLGDWVPPFPQCATHASVPAAAVCPRCRRPVCAECVYPLPAGLRCRACRPLLERLVPNRLVAPLALVGSILGRRWALQTVAFCAGLAALLWCCPNLVRPQAPELPDWLAGSRLQAPFLEQAFRLSSAGNAFSERGHETRARTYYERAEVACRRHLAEAGESPLNPQVWLGIGRLQERQGHWDEAKATFGRLMKDSPVRGVAAYYLGQIAETHDKNPAGALVLYELALTDAQQDTDALQKLVGYFAEDREKNQWPYVVASLTDTVTSANAIKDEIEQAIARCQSADSGQPERGTPMEFLGAE